MVGFGLDWVVLYGMFVLIDLIWISLVCVGLVWLSLVWFGLVSIRLVWFWYDLNMYSMVCNGLVWVEQVWFTLECYRFVFDRVHFSFVWFGMCYFFSFFLDLVFWNRSNANIILLICFVFYILVFNLCIFHCSLHYCSIIKISFFSKNISLKMINFRDYSFLIAQTVIFYKLSQIMRPGSSWAKRQGYARALICDKTF